MYVYYYKDKRDTRSNWYLIRKSKIYGKSKIILRNKKKTIYVVSEEDFINYFTMEKENE